MTDYKQLLREIGTVLDYYGDKCEERGLKLKATLSKADSIRQGGLNAALESGDPTVGESILKNAMYEAQEAQDAINQSNDEFYVEMSRNLNLLVEKINPAYEEIQRKLESDDLSDEQRKWCMDMISGFDFSLTIIHIILNLKNKKTSEAESTEGQLRDYEKD